MRVRRAPVVGRQRGMEGFARNDLKGKTGGEKWHDRGTGPILEAWAVSDILYLPKIGPVPFSLPEQRHPTDFPVPFSPAISATMSFFWCDFRHKVIRNARLTGRVWESRAGLILASVSANASHPPLESPG